MLLPAHPQGGVQIGISDILQWRDCPTRMEFGMRRHEGQDPPESWSPENAYGAAVHHCIKRFDDGLSPQAAIDEAFRMFPQWLEPSDLSQLADDLERYSAREQLGVRTLLNEGEISIPLFTHPIVGQVWFRARIDRLTQSLDDPGLLFHVDYKSSKWPRSNEEVAEDLQLWSYNLAIVEWFERLYPEVEHVRLLQTYDQLRYGEIPTQKSAAQRQEIRTWLVSAITSIIEDKSAEPSFNQWCPWCPLKMDCPVVHHQLTDWALTRIAALMPRQERLNKDGTTSKRPGQVLLDPDRIGEYVELLPDIHRAGQVLERFEKELGEVLKQMPDTELARLGKRKSARGRRSFSTEAKRAIVELVGLPTALMLFDLSLAAIDRFYGAKSPEGQEIAALAEKQDSFLTIVDL